MTFLRNRRFRCDGLTGTVPDGTIKRTAIDAAGRGIYQLALVRRGLGVERVVAYLRGRGRGVGPCPSACLDLQTGEEFVISFNDADVEARRLSVKDLVCIARDPGVRLRDIGDRVAITERAAHRIVTDLATAGYITRTRAGRHNNYTINADTPLPDPIARQQNVGELLTLSTRQRSPKPTSSSPPGRKPRSPPPLQRSLFQPPGPEDKRSRALRAAGSSADDGPPPGGAATWREHQPSGGGHLPRWRRPVATSTRPRVCSSHSAWVTRSGRSCHGAGHTAAI